jgi:hypothetical protein
MENLAKYNERIYISSVLCDLSYNFYSNLYNISLLPTILGSSLLTVINTAEIPDNILKIINISINGLNTIILALVNSYKINDRITLFKNHKIKFTKLNHLAESLINKKDEITDITIVSNEIINEYDKLQEELIYQYPSHIKRKVINKYGNRLTLPNSLEIETSIKADFINRVA